MYVCIVVFSTCLCILVSNLSNELVLSTAVSSFACPLFLCRIIKLARDSRKMHIRSTQRMPELDSESITRYDAGDFVHDFGLGDCLLAGLTRRGFAGQECASPSSVQ
ncbi:hypothetical protein V1506DRAFT_544860 [Lipomyces tetrasporus]